MKLLIILALYIYNASSVEYINCLDPKVRIGHRVGGNFYSMEENDPKNLKIIEKYQHLKCFWWWEFDLNSTRDNIVMFHDKHYKGKALTDMKSTNIPAALLKEFYYEFKKLKLSRGIKFDLKRIKKSHYKKVFKYAKRFKDIAKKSKVPFKIIMSHKEQKKTDLDNILRKMGYKVAGY